MSDPVPPELIGYADPWCAAPGDRVRLMVSTDLPSYQADMVRLIHGDENPDGPGFKEEAPDTSISGRYDGRKQAAYCGSYAIVADSTAFAHLTSFTVQAWIFPTTPQKPYAQGLVTTVTLIDPRFNIALDPVLFKFVDPTPDRDIDR